MMALILALDDPLPAPVTAYAECLVEQARALDDGKSDAATIGAIVREQCRAAERAAAIALSGDNDYENRASVVEQIEWRGLSRATRAVLRLRAQR